MREFHHFWFYLLLLAFLAQNAVFLFARWRTPSRGRGAALRAAMVALSLLAGFVVAEGAFYLFVDVTDGAMALLTSRRWAYRHMLPPGEFRNPPASSDQAPAGGGGAEICVLGDSLTYGQGVERAEDLYPSLLQRDLRRAGVRARVVNISQLGWDTRTETEAFDELLRSGYRCQVLVLGYCLNDIQAYVRFPPDVAAATARLTEYPPALAPLANRSFLVSWLYNRWVVATAPALRRLEDSVVSAYADPRAFAAHTADLSRLKALCDRNNIRLVVATFPHVVSPWAEYRYREVHRRLGDFWASQGVPHVDLLGAFERHYYRDLQASVFDTHPNELAHRIAGEQVYAELARRMGLPPEAQRR